MTVPVSPFLTFAERSQYLADYAKTEEVQLSPQFDGFLEKAERHARLLAEIETWTNSPWDGTPTVMSVDGKADCGYWQGESDAKAHIKALLEQGT